MLKIGHPQHSIIDTIREPLLAREPETSVVAPFICHDEEHVPVVYPAQVEEEEEEIIVAFPETFISTSRFEALRTIASFFIILKFFF